MTGEDEEIDVDVADDDPWFDQFDVTVRCDRMGLLLLAAEVIRGGGQYQVDAVRHKHQPNVRRTAEAIVMHARHVQEEIEGVTGSPVALGSETGFPNLHLTEDRLYASFEVVDVQEAGDDG